MHTKIFQRQQNCPVEWVQFVVFEEFSSAYLHQIAWEITMLLLDNKYMKKGITENQDGQSFCSMHELFVIFTYITTFHSC